MEAANFSETPLIVCKVTHCRNTGSHIFKIKETALFIINLTISSHKDTFNLWVNAFICVVIESNFPFSLAAYKIDRTVAGQTSRLNAALTTAKQRDLLVTLFSVSFLFFSDVLLVTFPTMASTRGQGFVVVFYSAREVLQAPNRHPASDNILVVLQARTSAYAVKTHITQRPYHSLVKSKLQVHLKLLIRILQC
jgi:hypothetical protein